MERSAGQPPDRPRPDEAPTAPSEDDQPATRGEVRSLRRWVAVAGVWAVAATAVAIIALVDRNEGTSDKTAADDSAAQLSRVQRELDRRLDDLEEQVRDLPRSSDLKKLEDRVRRAEDQAASAADDAGKTKSGVDDLKGRLDDLEQRVDDLESSPPDQGQQAP